MSRRFTKEEAAYCAIALLALLALFLFIQLRHLSKQVPFAASDADVIAAARQSKAETGADDYSMRNRFPVVISFEGARCVALRSPRGFLSRTFVYCFDDKLKPVDMAPIQLTSLEAGRAVDDQKVEPDQSR